MKGDCKLKEGKIAIFSLKSREDVENSRKCHKNVCKNRQVIFDRKFKGFFPLQTIQRSLLCPIVKCLQTHRLAAKLSLCGDLLVLQLLLKANVKQKLGFFRLAKLDFEHRAQVCSAIKVQKSLYFLYFLSVEGCCGSKILELTRIFALLFGNFQLPVHHLELYSQILQKR